jgi:Icc-related predicted phosphoesterase
MDSAEIDHELQARDVSLNGRGVELDSIGFFGVSGAPLSPLATPYEFAEDALAAEIERGWAMVRDCRHTIFCPHAPPAGTLCDRLASGEHVGSTAVRSYRRTSYARSPRSLAPKVRRYRSSL